MFTKYTSDEQALTQGAMDASNLLKPMLGRGELRCIGATTLVSPCGTVLILSHAVQNLCV